MTTQQAFTRLLLSATDTWPVRYRGIGVEVQQGAAGYSAITATGYASPAYATPAEALANATAAIDARLGPKPTPREVAQARDADTATDWR
jgi:hypothetical protein